MRSLDPPRRFREARPADDAGGLWFGRPSASGCRSTSTPCLPIDARWDATIALAPRAWVALWPPADQLSLLDLRRVVHRAAAILPPGCLFTFWIRDPDAVAAPHDNPENRPRRPWPGFWVGREGAYVRPWRHYHELFRLFPFRLATPRPIGAEGRNWALQALKSAATSPLANDPDRPPADRYGPQSDYRCFDRFEEPEILDDVLYGASRLGLRPGSRVLSVGVNDAREWAMFQHPGPEQLELWGVDHCAAAIGAARARFPEHAARLICATLDTLDTLQLPTFDAVVALNTLQVTTIDRDRLLSSLRRLSSAETHYLISIPNCHRGDEEVLRRPLDRRDPRHDRGLVLKDLRYLTRFFYRAGHPQIETFGTYDLFLLVKGRRTT